METLCGRALAHSENPHALNPEIDVCADDQGEGVGAAHSQAAVGTALSGAGRGTRGRVTMACGGRRGSDGGLPSCSVHPGTLERCDRFGGRSTRSGHIGTRPGDGRPGSGRITSATAPPASCARRRRERRYRLRADPLTGGRSGEAVGGSATRRTTRAARVVLPRVQYVGLPTQRRVDDACGSPDLPPIVVPVVKLVPGASGLPTGRGGAV